MTKEDLKGFMSRGVESAKQALGKASKAASKFGDESILKIEIQQFKSQIKKDKTELGELAYKVFAEDGAESLAKADENVAKLLDDIKKAQEEIKTREEKLENGKLKTEN
jgi:hypothetical protein